MVELRSFNDWYLRYWLSSVPGVAEIATIGGFVKQYQVNVDPTKLLAYGIPLNRIIEVIRASNNEGRRGFAGDGRKGISGSRPGLHSLN